MLLAQAVADMDSALAIKAGLAVVTAVVGVATYYLKGSAESLRKMQEQWGVVVERQAAQGKTLDETRATQREQGEAQEAGRLEHERLAARVLVLERGHSSMQDRLDRQDKNIHDVRDIAQQAVLAARSRGG